MKKNLYIIGAGDLGREVESWLELLPNFHQYWEIKGYIDQKPTALKKYPSDYEIIGNPENFIFEPNDHVIICITDPVSKKKMSDKLTGKVEFFSYVAPNAVIGKYNLLGKGVIICPTVCISTNVILEDFVFINCGTQIGHDCIIKKYSSLMAHVDLGGHVNLGRGVYVGTGATIIPNRAIGDNIKIGTGSVVIKDLNKAGTYFGNPAKLVQI